MINNEDSEYEKLKNRIDELIERYEIERTESEEEISSFYLDQIRSLRILCHAEIEDYIESLARNLLKEAEIKWNSERIANNNLAALFITSDRIATSDTYITKSNKIIRDYKDMLRRNHGIKEENIRKIFGPLGYSLDDFDAFFIGNLSTFGTLRGQTAHSSARRALQIDDFETEASRILDIYNGLKDFEIALRSS